MSDLKAGELRNRNIPILHDMKGKNNSAKAFEYTQQNLENAFNFSQKFRYADIERLVDYEFDNPVITLYLTLSGGKTLREDKVYLTHFNSLSKEEQKRKKHIIDSLLTKGKEQLRSDLKQIQGLLVKLADLLTEEMRSLVIIKSGEEINIVLNLLVPFEFKDKLVIGHNAHITPLVKLNKKAGFSLICDVSKDETIFYTFDLGRIEEVDRVEYPSYSKTNVKAERTAGKGQAHLQSHLHSHLKDSATKAYQLNKKYNFDAVFVMGDTSLLKTFKEYLSHQLVEKLQKSIVKEPNETIEAIRDKIYKSLSKKEVKLESESLKILEKATKKGLSLMNLPEVISAQNQFMTKAIYLDFNKSAKGFKCPKHDYLSLEKGKCPIGGEKLEPVDDVLDELLELAINYHIDFHIISEEKNINFDKVAAILYPWKN